MRKTIQWKPIVITTRTAFENQMMTIRHRILFAIQDFTCEASDFQKTTIHYIIV